MRHLINVYDTRAHRSSENLCVSDMFEISTTKAQPVGRGQLTAIRVHNLQPNVFSETKSNHCQYLLQVLMLPVSLQRKSWQSPMLFTDLCTAL